MARGRVVSPDFWADETMVELTPFARLFYIGLWNFAWCDNGHLPDEPFGLKLKVLPADPVKGSDLVAELIDAGKLVRDVLPDGGTFLTMPTFRRHQSVDARWKSRCVVCNSLKLNETQPSLSEHGQTQTKTLVREEKRKEEKKKTTSVRAALEQDFNEFWKVYPRKEGKQAALRRYTTIRKTVGAQPILEGARSYALMSLGKEKEHVKMAQGWLNDGRWADEFQGSIPLPPRDDAPVEHVHRWLPNGTCNFCDAWQDGGNPF